MMPPFCPNPRCVHHFQDETATPQTPFWIRKGVYFTKVVGPVPRFKCLSCGKSFSLRTFSFDYYTKKSLDNQEIFRSISSGESLSSISRHLSCSVTSVQNRLDRLGRNSIALHATLTKDAKFHEHIAADGFESFDRSQYFPNNINILVGTRSQFLYEATHTTIRRKGQMKEYQKDLRSKIERVYRAPRRGIVNSFTRLVSRIPEYWDRSIMPELRLRTDEHKAYPVSLEGVSCLNEKMSKGAFIHERYSSKVRRTVFNPLFPVNYYDRELRKDIAAYRRESTCYTRNVGNGLLRFAVHMAWHNYRKDYRVGVRGFEGITHAMMAGIDGEVVEKRYDRMFRERAFLSRTPVSQEWFDIWLKRKKTPLKSGCDYVPKFACPP